MNKVYKRIISLIIILTILVAGIPLHSERAAASPTYEAEPKWLQIGNHKGEDGKEYKAADSEWFKAMRGNIENQEEDTRYYRLEENIDVSCNIKEKTDWISEIKIKKNVVLDLNGYKLTAKVYEGTGSSAVPVYKYLFNIEEGGSLTIVDSEGGGGIHADSWIPDPKDIHYSYGYDSKYCNYIRSRATNCVNMFLVNAGGELVINASGAEFECGRSKKQWVTESNGASDIFIQGYTGYIRGQSCGSVVTVKSGGKATIAGGTLLARGFERWINLSGGSGGASFDNRCAVVKLDDSATVEIVDGILKGKGSADVFQCSKKSVVKVKAGTFDTHKLERMADVGGGYLVGSYGDIGLSSSAVDLDTADLIVGGETVGKDDQIDGTSKKTIVQPKSDTKNPSAFITTYTENGSESFNKSKGTGFILKTRYSGTYFDDTASEFLDKDYQNKTLHCYIWTYTLCDADGNPCESEPISLFCFSYQKEGQCDISKFKNKDGSDFEWSDGKYKVKCEVSEYWCGENEYKRNYFNWFEFSHVSGVSEQLIDKVDFDAEIVQTNGDSDNSSIRLALNVADSTRKLIKDCGISDKVLVSYSYRYYYVDDNGETKLSPEYTIVDKSLAERGLSEGDNSNIYFTSKAVGPVEISLKLWVPGSNAGDNYNTLRVRKNYFLMPAISAAVQANDGTIGAWKWPGSYVFKLNEGEKAVLNPNFYEAIDGVKFSLKDPISGKNLSIERMIWQYSEECDEEGEDIWVDVDSSEYSKDTHCITVDRSAYYRTKYVWEGKNWYSPYIINLDGKNYNSNRTPYISGVEETELGLEGNNLKININSDANWDTIESYALILKEKPVGAKVTVSSKTNKTGEFDINSFFRTISSEDFVSGTYVFEGIVRGYKQTQGYREYYKARSALYTVTFKKPVESLYILSNGITINDPSPDDTETPYFVSEETNNLTFTTAYYPSDATYNPYASASVVWESSNPDVIKIDKNTGAAKILMPGTTVISVSCGKMSESVEVRVPIAGFELEQVDYSKYLGQDYKDIVPKVKSVWSYDGAKITENVEKYIQVVSRGYDGTTVKNVEYNDYGKVSYRIMAKEGYSFPLTIDDSYSDTTWYKVDTNKLMSNGFDGTEIKSVYSIGGYHDNFSYYKTGISHGKFYEEFPAHAAYIRLSDEVFIQDPEATYIDNLNITTSVPAVGDSRYEGDYTKGYNEFMIMNISTLSDVKADDGYDLIRCSHSWVSKLEISELKGSGTPYKDASTEKLYEFADVINYSEDFKPTKPTKLYEEGIYANSVSIGTSSSSVGGKKYYFSPDIKVYINGNLIDYGYVSYKYKASSVSFDYYFDVGKIDTINNALIDGLALPKQGAEPSSAEDAVIVNTETGDTYDDVYVSKLIWFVDENANGQYDEGEECSAGHMLSEDGKFIEDTVYSIYLELKSEETRISTDNFSLKLNVDGETVVIAENARSGYYTYKVTKKEEQKLLGDINQDGIINASDALLVLKHAAKLSILDEKLQSVADVNGDKIIDASDALMILKIAAKLI